MDAQPIFSTRDFMQAQAACEALRAKDVKCGFVEGAPPMQRLSWYGLAGSSGMGHTGTWDVVVAPEDVERATAFLRSWVAGATTT